MANTNLDKITPKLLAGGLLALRQNCKLPRLVNTSYSDMAARKGSVINVPLPSALAAYDITPTVTGLAAVDSAPTEALVTLDFWKGASFHLTDKEAAEIETSSFMPMQVSEAQKALGNAVTAYIASKHVGFFATAGAAGTTPFATTIAVAGEARKKLNKQLAPVDNRFAVLDPDAENNLLQVTNVLEFDKSGDKAALVEGSIGRKLGFDWHMDQNVTTYTPGSAWVDGYTTATGGAAAGATSMAIQDKGGDQATGAIKIGDIFTVAGAAQQYVVTTAIATVTVSASTAFTISFYPALATAAVSSAALTVIATAYTVNLAAHRDALAWASRPLNDIPTPGSTISSMVDPVSGIALRLEVKRHNKMTVFEYDILGGANVVRREFGVKILG